MVVFHQFAWFNEPDNVGARLCLHLIKIISHTKQHAISQAMCPETKFPGQ